MSSNSAKTTHGLLRKSDRFNIVGVIDENHAGRDAGEILDGKNRNVPCYASIKEAVKANRSAKYLIIGIATPGGKIPEQLKKEILEAIDHGLSIVN
ncbi:MAG: DUF1611 domain-containing protein, partial [Bacteroidota bacterium]